MFATWDTNMNPIKLPYSLVLPRELNSRKAKCMPVQRNWG